MTNFTLPYGALRLKNTLFKTSTTSHRLIIARVLKMVSAGRTQWQRVALVAAQVLFAQCCMQRVQRVQRVQGARRGHHVVQRTLSALSEVERQASRGLPPLGRGASLPLPLCLLMVSLLLPQERACNTP